MLHRAITRRAIAIAAAIVLSPLSVVLTDSDAGATPIVCPAWQRTSLATADAYLNAQACPLASFSWSSRRGYVPIWSFHAGRWHVIDPVGGCTGVPATGASFDFRAACKAHDYCYDLGREQYPNISKGACDWVFREVMLEDCAVRSWWPAAACARQATAYYVGVVVGGGLAWG